MNCCIVGLKIGLIALILPFIVTRRRRRGTIEMTLVCNVIGKKNNQTLVSDADREIPALGSTDYAGNEICAIINDGPHPPNGSNSVPNDTLYC